DYAHHPSEIKASLKALKEIKCKKMYIVFQPHTYSRTKALYEEFVDALKDADNLIMVDIYAARENNIYNISSEDIINEINNRYHKNAV
ncbi:MAG: UDP-N-acetylmuramate--L-alanine ligase, partial [Lachnospiraceae bacterium]|nr:UDP-N-acetylmuramate--L-alanine ligase [Lachnospiraceae bacterium]